MKRCTTWKALRTRLKPEFKCAELAALRMQIADCRSISSSAPVCRAKLTDHEVDLIRELIEEGMSLREIAAKFEVHYTAVEAIEPKS